MWENFKLDRKEWKENKTPQSVDQLKAIIGRWQNPLIPRKPVNAGRQQSKISGCKLISADIHDINYYMKSWTVTDTQAVFLSWLAAWVALAA